MTFSKFKLVIISCLFVGLGILFTYPSIHFFSDGIPMLGQGAIENRSGDHLQLFYWFWLIKDNLFGDSILFTNPYEFNTVAGPLDLGFHMFPFSLIFVFFSPLGDIAAYNCTIWATFVLTGIFTYLLVRQYEIHHWGAICAAIVFTLIPFRIAQMVAGHLNGFIFFCLPMILYFHERAVKHQSWVAGCISALGICALAVMEPHLIYYLFMLLGAYLPFRAFLRFTPSANIAAHLSQDGESSYRAVSTPRKWGAIIRIWLAGLAMVFFYQQILSGFRGTEILHVGLWAALAVYPVILLAAVLLLSAIVSRMAGISPDRFFRKHSHTYWPFYLLPLYGVVANLKIPHLGTILGITAFLVVGWLNKAIWADILQKFKAIHWKSVRTETKPLLKFHLPILTCMGLVVIYLLASKLALFNDSIVTGGRKLADVALFSPELGDIINPGNTNPERLIYIGVIALMSVLYSFYRLLHGIVWVPVSKVTKETMLVGFCLFLFLITYTLALGLSFGEVSLYEFCFNHIPFFNYPRVSGRIAIISFWAVAVLTALSVKELVLGFRNSGQLRLAHFVGVLICVLLILDFHPLRATGIARLTSQPIYQSIPAKENSKLLEIPFWPGDSHQSSLYEYYTTLDTIPRINGYSPIVTRDFVENVYNPLYGLNLGRLNYEQYKMLRNLEVSHITVHTNPEIFPLKISGNPPLFTVRQLQGSPYLERVTTQNGIHLFKVLESKRQTAVDSSLLPLVKITDAQLLKPDLGVFHVDDSINALVVGARPLSTLGGELTNGPYIYLPAGHYYAKIRINANIKDKSKPIIKILIHTSRQHESHLLTERTISGHQWGNQEGYQDIQLPFIMDEPGYAEFSLFYPKTAEINVAQIVVTSSEPEGTKYLYEAEALPGYRGQTVADAKASAGHVIYADPETVATSADPDYIVNGPNVYVPAGTYLSTFGMRMQSDKERGLDESLGTVDLTIVTDKGRHILASRTVLESEAGGENYREIPLVWRLENPENIAFRILPKTGVHAWLDTIHTHPINPAPIIADIPEPKYKRTVLPFRSYKAANLPRTTGRLFIDDITKMKMAEAREVHHNQGYLSYGPYSKLPAGRWQARFHLKARHTAGTDPLANIDVATSKNNRVYILSQRTLTGRDFTDSNEYQIFTVPFDSTLSEPLEFRVEYLGHGDLRLKMIELYLHELTIEAENQTPLKNKIISDSLASGGRAVRTNGTWRHTRLLPAGNYQLDWRLKPGKVLVGKSKGSDSEVRKFITTLQIFDATGDQLAHNELTPRDFQTDGYHRVLTNLSLPQKSNITLVISGDPDEPIILDSVLINALQSEKQGPVANAY